MEIQDFITKFADQFDETDASVFTIETKFRELEEWSSLTALSVLNMLENEYNIRLTFGELRCVDSIQDLYDFVVEKLQ